MSWLVNWEAMLAGMQEFDTAITGTPLNPNDQPAVALRIPSGKDGLVYILAGANAAFPAIQWRGFFWRDFNAHGYVDWDYTDQVRRNPRWTRIFWSPAKYALSQEKKRARGLWRQTERGQIDRGREFNFNKMRIRVPHK